jgi:hypothetical protein
MAIVFPLVMQRRAAALYSAFFLLVILGGYVLIASTGAVPVSDSPAYTLNKGEQFAIDGQQYVVSEITSLVDQNGHIKRSASFKLTGENKTVSFNKSTAITMLVVQNGLPTLDSYTPSTGTVTLGGEEYGAYYSNNNTVKLMSGEVHNREVSRTKSLNERFRGMWVVMVLSSLSGILMIGMSYLPRRG